GKGEKIYAGRNDPHDVSRARAWWGDDVTASHEGSAVSAALTGTIYTAIHEECPHVEYAGIVIEFGTLALVQVFGALRADQWLHNHPNAPPPTRAAIKHAIRRAFYPDAADWRESVVNQARAAVFQALTNLRADSDKTL